jgi:nicotinamide mononucleotide adenylyltransferase
MIALFPCKLDPPHLGHVITLLNIKDDYEKIIIDILDHGEERLISPKEAISTIDQVLKHFPGKFEYRTHRQSYTLPCKFKDLPNFDVVVSGNQVLLDNMHRHGYATRHTKRTPVYQARFIREAYRIGLEREGSFAEH